jgi:MFS family permease
MESEKKTGWELMKVIFASSVGTLIEWYDFYIYGSLAPIIAKQFFPQDNPTAAYLAALATFAAGFIVRPFGALVFGRLGDIVGRKYTFLVTLLLMGGSTFAIGLVPSYAKIGMWAPAIILSLRFLQGLALGGEYGGAATYVAEHSPLGRRGYFTSYIQTTATLGLFLSLGVILLTRKTIGIHDFNEWGWRIPFWASIILVGMSVYIRLRMEESPLFSKLKKEGKTAKNPLKESFSKKANLKMVLLALFGAVMGQGVIWYTGQFYAQSFIERTCSVEFEQTRYILCIAIMMATPFFLVFGAWSDKVGRKWIMLTGMLLGILTYRPIYRQIYDMTNPKIKTEIAEKSSKSSQLVVTANGDSLTSVTTLSIFTDGSTFKEVNKKMVYKDKTQTVPKAEIVKTMWLSCNQFWALVFLVFIQILYVTMVYGPIAAFLVELFPTRIRYTSMSLPYHIGNGIFGGLTPFIATRLTDANKATVETAKIAGDTTATTDPLVGLWYPIAIAAVCFVIGALYLPNKNEENKE